MRALGGEGVFSVAIPVQNHMQHGWLAEGGTLHGIAIFIYIDPEATPL